VSGPVNARRKTHCWAATVGPINVSTGHSAVNAAVQIGISSLLKEVTPTGISEHINTEVLRYRSLIDMAIATEAVW
jgi:hypothetical protein